MAVFPAESLATTFGGGALYPIPDIAASAMNRSKEGFLRVFIPIPLE
jgi:hypothetical protein